MKRHLSRAIRSVRNHDTPRYHASKVISMLIRNAAVTVPATKVAADAGATVAIGQASMARGPLMVATKAKRRFVLGATAAKGRTNLQTA